jgi:hypothetical protein
MPLTIKSKKITKISTVIFDTSAPLSVRLHSGGRHRGYKIAWHLSKCATDVQC